MTDRTDIGTDGRPDAAVSEFIEGMGLVVQAEGLPRGAGRLLALLVIEGGPLSFGEIGERLRISRASVSNNTRLLEGLGVIERLGRPGERQDYFRLTEAPFRRLLEGAVERTARARSVVERAESRLPADWRDARRRLRELGEFYATAEEHTRNLVGSLRPPRA